MSAANNQPLTTEEIATLKQMQASLKTEFAANSLHSGGYSSGESVQFGALRASTAATGYAAVTDLLSRHRLAGGPG